MTATTIAWPLVEGLYRSPALTGLGLVAAFTPASFGSMAGSVFPQAEQRENRDMVARRLGFPTVVRVKQVHGNRVVYAPFVRAEPVATPARAPLPPSSPAGPQAEGRWPEADALWTDSAGVLLGVSAADCVPVLIADPDGRIGAAHAGWRGTSERVAQVLVRALVAGGTAPARLVAALGPAIGPCCYTIDEERAALIRQRLGSGPWLIRVTPSGGAAAQSGARGREAAWSFDLWAANATQLRDAGVGTIEVAGMCTRCGGADLWSFRSRRERGQQGTAVAVLGRPG